MLLQESHLLKMIEWVMHIIAHVCKIIMFRFQEYDNTS